MIKLIRTSDTQWNEKVSSLVEVTSRGVDSRWLEKRAGAVLQKEFDELEPSKKYAWVHTLAIGSTEGYGPNRNGDGFSEEWLKLKHPTFTKHAHVFENHKNKDPKKAIGIVKFSAYNPEMRRTELIYGLEYGKADKYIEKLAAGEDLMGSMGCRVSHDVCSICGHKAPTPKQYCDHTKMAMCQILDDGRQVFVDNPDPSFFDWSQVGRGADRIAFGLQSKVASEDSPIWESSVDLAKHAGLWVPKEYQEAEGLQRVYAKHAILKKLCEMEKEVATKLTPLDIKVKDSMVPEAIPCGDVAKMKKAGLSETLGNMHANKVVLPVKDFLKLISDSEEDDLDDVSEDVQNKLPGVFGRMEDDEDKSPLENTAFDGDGPLDGPVGSLVEDLIPKLGMGAEPLAKRVTISVIKAKPKVASSRPISPEPEIETIARLYATYKLAALSHPKNADDVMLTRSALLQNYHHHA